MSAFGITPVAFDHDYTVSDSIRTSGVKYAFNPDNSEEQTKFPINNENLDEINSGQISESRSELEKHFPSANEETREDHIRSNQLKFVLYCGNSSQRCNF